MLEKLEKLIAIWTACGEELLIAAIAYNVKTGTTARTDAATESPKEQPQTLGKTRKPRAPKEEKVETTARNLFDVIAQPAAATSPSPEDAVEASRRGKEIMGLFIRRYLKAQPPGIDRAKAIIIELLGQPRNGGGWKFEDFTHADWLKLTPRFERELEQADAK